jgi:hypothetical protein
VIILAIAILGSSPSASDLNFMIRIVLMIVAVPFSIVVASALILGIPLTLLLKYYGRESLGAYMWAGGLAGIAVTQSFGLAGVNIYFTPVAMLGAFSGAVTARSWWRHYRAAIVMPEAQRFSDI